MSVTFDPAGEAQAAPSLDTPFLEVAPAAWTAPVAQPAGGVAFLAEAPFVSEYVVGERTIRPEEPALRDLLEDDAQVTFSADAGATTATLDGPLVLVGTGAVSLLPDPPQTLRFSNPDPNPVDVDVLVGRNA